MVETMAPGRTTNQATSRISVASPSSPLMLIDCGHPMFWRLWAGRRETITARHRRP